MINSIRQTILTITVCFAAISGYDCGSPLEPVDSLWKAVASLSGYHCNDLQCGPDGSVYIASGNSIYRFEDGDFTVYAEFDTDAYITQFTLDGGGLVCLENDYGNEYYLYRRTGGIWSQIELPAGIIDIYDIVAVNSDIFYIGLVASDWSYSIFCYNQGIWTEYSLGRDTHPLAMETSPDGMVYALIESNNPEYGGGIGLSTLIIDSRSGLYIMEPIEFRDEHIGLGRIGPGWYSGNDGFSYYGNSLHLITGISINGINFYGLIERVGEPGEGEWVPDVLLPEKSPDTGTVESIAFDGRGRALICGYETSIVNEGDGVWQKELFDYNIGYLRGSPEGGFWGTCRGYLYYHP